MQSILRCHRAEDETLEIEERIHAAEFEMRRWAAETFRREGEQQRGLQRAVHDEARVEFLRPAQQFYPLAG
jgi:hypothetical protein